MEEYNEGNEGNAKWSDSCFSRSCAGYWELLFHHHIPIGEGCPSSGPLSSWLGMPLPFTAMVIRVCREHQADVTHQVCHTPHFLPVGIPPLNSGWFGNGSSLEVSQSCQSPPQALSALTLRSQSTVIGEGEESTHLCSSYKGGFCLCNQL